MPTLIDLEGNLSSLPSKVILTGKDLTIPQIISVARKNSTVEFTTNPVVLKRIKDCYEVMIKNVKDGIPIYGTNSGYGGRAGHVLNKGSQRKRLNLAKKISEGIAHIDVSVGPLFPKDVVRAAMLIRINMLLKGVSAVKLKDLDIYRQMLNFQISPLVNQYGGIGASGDLAHNARVLSAARGLNGSFVQDKIENIIPSSKALKKAGIPLLKLDPKAGLGLVNGDNFSTALASLLTVDTLESFLISTVLGAITIGVLKGTNRSFHQLLGIVRPHPGQIEVAAIYRFLLHGSRLTYQEMYGHTKRPDGTKIQDAYSLRSISQYHGVNADKIKQAYDVITINANSASDNPLWVPPEFISKGETPWGWVSGGNFLASQMVEVIDGLRKTMTQIVKLNDRHLGRMVNPHENAGLPPNLSDKKALTQCAFKGIQIQSGMFDIYSTLLSIPVSTFFGIHEEGNQDITTHALTSAIFALENLRLVRYSLAQNLLAVAQAVDLRGGVTKLSPHTQPLYRFIRERVSYVKTERPLHVEIETLYESIKNGELSEVLREKVFQDYHN